MVRVRENNTEKTKARILQASEAVIAELGFDNLTVTKVAQSLSMSHGNIYRHFPSKADLIAAIATIWMQEMRDACEAAIKDDAPAKVKLVSLIFAIREQLALRSTNPEALNIYGYVLLKRPEDARFHHRHRGQLFKSILVDRTNLAPAFEDAFRYFTDPNTFLQSQTDDVSDRIDALAALLLTQ